MAHTEVAARPPVISIAGLQKSYGAQRVLADLDLAVDDRIHALLGPNGAGKTTLINILSTLIPADGGTAQILGMDLRTQRKDIKRHISVTGQFAAVDEGLSGKENIEMMAKLLGLSTRAARTRSATLLEEFDLTGAATKRARTYSGGMRRRLDLAISMINAPALLFLDEPTTGLDTVARQNLWGQVRALAQAGTAVFLTTQYLEEADVLADRISVLNDGRIIAQGTAAELKSSVGGAVIELLDGEGHPIKEVTTDGSAQSISEAMAAQALEHPQAQVAIRRPSLDEAFIQLTAKPQGETSTRQGASR